MSSISNAAKYFDNLVKVSNVSKVSRKTAILDGIYKQIEVGCMIE